LMGQAAVTDGDTIAIHKQCIRLWAVDASEANRSRIKQPRQF
jgi:endonuclease YncB( thermonuclease family)